MHRQTATRCLATDLDIAVPNVCNVVHTVQVRSAICCPQCCTLRRKQFSMRLSVNMPCWSKLPAPYALGRDSLHDVRIHTSPRTMCSGSAYISAWFGPTCCFRNRATRAVSDGCSKWHGTSGVRNWSCQPQVATQLTVMSVLPALCRVSISHLAAGCCMACVIHQLLRAALHRRIRHSQLLPGIAAAGRRRSCRRVHS